MLLNWDGALDTLHKQTQIVVCSHARAADSCVLIRASARTCNHACTQICMDSYMYAPVCSRPCARAHIHTHTHTYTDTHTHTHTYTDTHTRARMHTHRHAYTGARIIKCVARACIHRHLLHNFMNNVQIHTHACMHKYYYNTHTDTHMHTQTQAQLQIQHTHASASRSLMLFSPVFSFSFHRDDEFEE